MLHNESWVFILDLGLPVERVFVQLSWRLFIKEHCTSHRLQHRTCQGKYFDSVSFVQIWEKQEGNSSVWMWHFHTKWETRCLTELTYQALMKMLMGIFLYPYKGSVDTELLCSKYALWMWWKWTGTFGRTDTGKSIFREKILIATNND